MKHRGEILEKYIRTEKVNLTKLADKLPWTVKTIYRHFTESDLALDKLSEYSKALRYDFKREIPELNAFKKVSGEAISEHKVSNNEQSNEEPYRKRYEDVLEKYNELLEKYATLLETRINP